MYDVHGGRDCRFGFATDCNVEVSATLVEWLVHVTNSNLLASDRGDAWHIRRQIDTTQM